MTFKHDLRSSLEWRTENETNITYQICPTSPAHAWNVREGWEMSCHFSATLSVHRWWAWKWARCLLWLSGWSQPPLQWFMGFGNFYCRFIQRFSSVAAMLTNLLKGKPRCITSTKKAKATFAELKRLFTWAPMLKLPAPTKQFIVKVDASKVGLGLVLSQRNGDLHKLHPYAFFSRKLSPSASS